MKSRNGSALISVILTVTVLTILGMAIVTIIQGRLSLSASYEGSSGALYVAQAGIEDMKTFINTQVDNCNVSVKSQLDTYSQSSGFDPSTVNTYTDNLVDTYFNTNLNNKTRTAVWTEKNTSYSAISTYTPSTNTITVVSTGDYNYRGRYFSERKITAKFQVDSGESYTLTYGSGGSGSSGGVPQTPLIVGGSPSSADMDVTCRSFDVYGPFYIPMGMANFASNLPVTFHNDLTVGDNLTFDASSLIVTVNGNMTVNGNLTLDGPNMVLNVNGDLNVKGDLIVSASNITVNVNNGNVKCNGSTPTGGVKMQSNDSVIHIAKNLNTPTTYLKPFNRNVLDVHGQTQYSNFQVTFNPATYTFGDTSVFQQAGVIKNLNNIDDDTFVPRGYGTKQGNVLTIGSINNPKVVFYNGDININLNYKTSQLDFYGIIYATGKIIINSWGPDPAQINIYGRVLTGQKMDIDQYSTHVKLDYDGSAQIMNNIQSSYPGVISYFSNTSTINVNIANGYSSTTWDE